MKAGKEKREKERERDVHKSTVTNKNEQKEKKKMVYASMLSFPIWIACLSMMLRDYRQRALLL